VPARSFTGSAAGIVTTGAFGRGRISVINPAALTLALDASLVPVVAGFQGSRSDGEVTTLGRGGSDTSAVAIAAALGLPCEIYTDVPGVFATDPRLVSDAQPRSILSHEAMACMSANGSKVVARRAVELASVYNVPLQVRSSFTWQSGTVVATGQTPLETCSVLAVSHDTSAVLVNVEGIRGDPNTLAVMLAALDRAQVPLTIAPRATIDDRAAVVGLVINRDDLDATVETLEPVAHSLGGRVVSKPGLSLVSVLGIGLTSYVGITGTVAATVGGISPAAELLIASPSVITWLVPAVVAHDVVRRLCDVLALRSTPVTHHTDAAAG
jgi:aspartate kinase